MHEGCTADFKPDHRWDEDDEVCRIRKFYGPKRAINTSLNDGLYPVYTMKECPQCVWRYWAGGRTTSPTCRTCWRIRNRQIRICPDCGESHVSTSAGRRCRPCLLARSICKVCGGRGDNGGSGGALCRICYRETLDPVKLKAQRRRSGNARRARKQAAQVAGPVSMRVYRDVVESGDCVYCGAEADTVDHIQPLARGGHEAEYNLVPACDYCNSSKCASPLTDWHHQELVRHAVRHSPKVAAVWAQLTGVSA